jgi:hypothetical protein
LVWIQGPVPRSCWKCRLSGGPQTLDSLHLCSVHRRSVLGGGLRNPVSETPLIFSYVGRIKTLLDFPQPSAYCVCSKLHLWGHPEAPLEAEDHCN